MFLTNQLLSNIREAFMDNDEIIMDENYNDIKEKWKKFIIIKDYEYWQSVQVNFSEEAGAVLKKVKDGKRLTELDVFILCNDNQKQIDEYRKFYNIRENIKNGNLSESDLDYLVETMCGDDKETSDMLKDKFSIFVKKEEEKIF